MRLRSWTVVFLAGLSISACGTYYDPSDPYVRGLRWFDRGDYATAKSYWEPLANAGDCDAQARLGYLLYAKAKPGREQQEAASLLQTAAERGQPFAQFWYGTLFYPGEIKVRGMDINAECNDCGISRDAETAYVWIVLARHNSVYSQFADMVDQASPQVRSALSQAQAQSADQRIAIWQPSGPECRPRKLL